MLDLCEPAIRGIGRLLCLFIPAAVENSPVEGHTMACQRIDPNHGPEVPLIPVVVLSQGAAVPAQILGNVENAMVDVGNADGGPGLNVVVIFHGYLLC